jgi:hypothetical protein
VWGGGGEGRMRYLKIKQQNIIPAKTNPIVFITCNYSRRPAVHRTCISYLTNAKLAAVLSPVILRYKKVSTMHFNHLFINIPLHVAVHSNVTDHGMGHYGSILGGERTFYLQNNIRTCSGVFNSCHPVGTRCYSPGDKASGS